MGILGLSLPVDNLFEKGPLNEVSENFPFIAVRKIFFYILLELVKN